MISKPYLSLYFSEISNTSNISLDNFFWHDALPIDAVRLKTIHTGVWNESLTYSVVYMTNLKSGYKTLAANLSGKTSHELDASPFALKLAAGEYITDIRFDFGTVKAGFREDEAPSFVVTTLATLPDGYRMDQASLNVTPTAYAAGVTAGRIKNGTYSIEVDSGTSMFKIVDCQLSVEDNGMTAVMTLSGQGFSHVYMGTGEQADVDNNGWIDFTDNGERHSFTVPVEALDRELDCSGRSAKKETWYDHTVIFKSANIPADAFLPAQIDVAMTGGTGRASIDSPTTLTYKDGTNYAEIVWGSPNYTYMIINDTKYLPVNTDGNSTFEIPVILDTDMKVIACTVAMSEPKEIEYTLRFDSTTIR